MTTEQRDKHIRRLAADYAQAMMTLLPTGQAWPREPGSVLEKTVTGLATIYEQVDKRAADLLEKESDPRKTVELLTDWERAWGLPDKCLAEPLTVRDRQIALVTKMTLLGAQSRQWFMDLATLLGYSVPSIREYAPWMFGVSPFGPTRDETGYWRWEIGPPWIRFYWTVFVGEVRLTWWQFSYAQFGVDPHLRIALATDIECLFRRYKPAHTKVIFDYDELVNQIKKLDSAQLVLSSTAPRVDKGHHVYPPQGDLALTFSAPSLIGNSVTIQPEAGELELSSLPVNIWIERQPGVGVLHFTSAPPSVVKGRVYAPASVDTAFSSAAPTVVISRNPPSGNMIINSIGPTLS